MNRVLIVEDSPTQAQELRLILESAGLHAETASDGEAALTRLAPGGIDLVLSDVLMPGLDGYELCCRIKGVWPDLPVILLTTLSEPYEVIRALECSADSFLTKPYDADNLIARVQRVLGSRRLRTSPGEGGGLDVAFLGKRFSVTAGREQILAFLVSMFEDAVRKNQDLQAAKLELAAKNESLVRLQRQKEELSALLVHDLRTPAAGIMMSAQARLRDRSIGDDHRVSWTNVFAAAEVISRMVVNLIDINRGEEGVFTPKLADVDVARLVSEVRHLMMPLAADREQQVQVDVEDGLPPVRADRELLRRVLQNLVDNAIRHSPSESIVRIEAAAADHTLVLRVRDQGSGVPPELRQRIFDKYVRAERRGEQDHFGKGLGLAFCRLAVEAHGGKIWIDDNRPAGSVFTVRLPLPPPGGAAA